MEDINSALDVSGFGIFDNDIFLLDSWGDEDGFNYLVGIATIFEDQQSAPGNVCDEYHFISYCVITTLEYESYSELEQPTIVSAFQRKLTRIKRLWNSGHHAASNPPAYYINWAISKKFKIPWINYAISEGYYKPISKPDQPKALLPVDPTVQGSKWRKAFEYESDGLNALYKLIEHHFFDAKGNPIYDPAQWPLKKNLKSSWLTGRTLDEADTIITSSKRKGKAEK